MTDIATVGVVGAGFMGSGIAEAVARAGVPVVVHEPEGAPLKRSRDAILRSVDKAVSRGKLPEEDAAALTERITWTKEFDELGAGDLVVEAIIEDAHVKGTTFQKLDALVGDQCILASNTSSIPIAQIASWTRNPERVLGLHFFSPVPVMKLVEVVVGLQTDPGVVDKAKDFAQSIGKHP